jgi:hypothetical protein
MILLNSEKQCIYMYKGRRAAAATAHIPLSEAVADNSLSAKVLKNTEEIVKRYEKHGRFMC